MDVWVQDGKKLLTGLSQKDVNKKAQQPPEVMIVFTFIAEIGVILSQ